MKRLALAVALIMSLPVGASHGAQIENEPHARLDEEATASWLIPKKKPRHYTWFALVASVREEPGGGTSSFAIPVRGSCKENRERTSIGCGGGGFVHELESGEFSMAADLSQARIDFRPRGKTYSADLEGTGMIPHLVLRHEICFSSNGEEGEGRGAGGLREARATGSFAGRAMKPSPSRLEFSDMARGAMVTECRGFTPQIVSLDGDRAEVRWTIPLTPSNS